MKRQISLLMSTNMVIWVIQLAKNIVLARLIAPEIFGTLALAAVYSSLCYRFHALWGLNYSLMHRQISPNHKEYHAHFYLSLFVCFIGYFASTSLAWLIESQRQKEVIGIVLMIAFCACIELLLSGAQIRIEKELRYKKLAIIRLASSLFGFGIPLYLATQGLAMQALISDRCLNSLLVPVSCALAIRFVPKINFQFADMRWFFSYGKHFWILQVCDALRSQAIEFYIARLSGLQNLAYYTKASSFAKIPLIAVMQNAIGTFLPIYSKNLENPKELCRIITKFNRFSLLLMGCIYGVLCVSAPQVVLFILGDAWLAVTPLIQLFGLIYFLKCFMDSLSNFFNISGHQKISMSKEVLQTSIVLILVPLLSMSFGVQGIAWGLLLANIPSLGYLYHQLNTKLSINLWPIILKTLLAFFLAFALTPLATSSLMELNQTLFAISKISFFLLSYLGIWIILEYKYLLKLWRDYARAQKIDS